jgi:hypothetical protein
MDPSIATLLEGLIIAVSTIVAAIILVKGSRKNGDTDGEE